MDIMKERVGSRATLIGILALACAPRHAECPEQPRSAEARPAAMPAADVITPPPPDGVPRSTCIAYAYSIPFGDQEIVVDPGDGGRVIAFRLGGRNILRERKDSEAYGSSFWTSPQSDWGWPPPFELALGAWESTLEGSALVLQSAKVESLGIDVTQRIGADLERRSVSFEYRINNRGPSPRKIAPWQNTRVGPGGLTLYPSAGPLAESSTLKFDAAKEIAFFKHDPALFKSGVKSFGDGKEGWLAHVDGDLVLIKTFPDVPAGAHAPKEAEIEIYVDGSGKFVEVEQQGAYAEIAPGASSTWLVTWYLRKLPEGVRAEPGSKELVEFIRGVVR